METVFFNTTYHLEGQMLVVGGWWLVNPSLHPFPLSCCVDSESFSGFLGGYLSWYLGPHF